MFASRKEREEDEGEYRWGNNRPVLRSPAARAARGSADAAGINEPRGPSSLDCRRHEKRGDCRNPQFKLEAHKLQIELANCLAAYSRTLPCPGHFSPSAGVRRTAARKYQVTFVQLRLQFLKTAPCMTIDFFRNEKVQLQRCERETPKRDLRIHPPLPGLSMPFDRDRSSPSAPATVSPSRSQPPLTTMSLQLSKRRPRLQKPVVSAPRYR